MSQPSDKQKPSDNSNYTMAWLKKRIKEIRAENIWPTLCAITEFQFHCVAFFLSFTLSLELLNGLRSAVGLTQRIPPFGDKLRQGLTLRPKLAASSNTVSEKWRQQHFNKRFALHLRADSHHDTNNIKESCISMYLTYQVGTVLTSGNRFAWHAVC